MGNKWISGEMLAPLTWIEAYSGKFHKQAALGLSVIVVFSLIYHAFPVVELTIMAFSLFIALTNLALNDSRAAKRWRAILTIVVYVSSISVICYWNVKHYI